MNKVVQLIAFFGLVTALLLMPRAKAEAPAENDPQIRIAEGKIYATVNGEEILGREVLDVLAETYWQEYLTPFVAYKIREEEVEKSKIVLTPEEIEEESKHYLRAQFGDALDMAKLEKEVGPGALKALKQTVRADLGLLRIYQAKKQVKEGIHITNSAFVKLKEEMLQKRIDAAGVITNPKELGDGEAVRIGPRGYGNDEVRRFILEAEGQIRKSTLGKILEQLVFEKVIKAEAAKKSISLTDEDRKFHFSYLCRIKGLETGVSGRAVMMQNLQRNQITAEQYMRTRVFTCDALVTMIVKQPIREVNLRAAFAVNPKKYQASENLTAHIFIPVLDPDGHPYNSQWRSNHFGPDAYVAQKREEQFAKVKPKIEGLLPLAKQDFEDTARKYSEDNSKKSGGIVGRIGARTVLGPPMDNNFLSAAIKLQPGQVSDVVRSDFGWHIIKCLEKQDVTYEEVSESIFLTLLFEARNELVNRLLKDAKVEYKY